MENAKKGKKTWKLIGNIVFWVVLAIVVVYSAVALFSRQDENMTTFLGMSALTVESDSMENTFYKGDLIFIKTDFNIADLSDDDVITFRATEVTDDGVRGYYNTHRIIDISDDRLFFYTKGDNAPADPDPVVPNDIIGVWTGVHLRGMGSFINFLKSSTGFLLFIVLPCLAFLVYEVVRFTKIYSQYQVQKSIGDRVKMQEEALAQAKAQLEQEQQAKAAKPEPEEDPGKK